MRAPRRTTREAEDRDIDEQQLLLCGDFGDFFVKQLQRFLDALLGTFADGRAEHAAGVADYRIRGANAGDIDRSDVVAVVFVRVVQLCNVRQRAPLDGLSHLLLTVVTSAIEEHAEVQHLGALAHRFFFAGHRGTERQLTLLPLLRCERALAGRFTRRLGSLPTGNRVFETGYEVYLVGDVGGVDVLHVVC